MLTYQNNFPRENAVKGQEFKGDSALKAELLERGIIAGDEEKEVQQVEKPKAKGKKDV